MGTTPPLASREAEPPSGGWRRPPGGSKSFRKILTMPPQRPRPCSTVSGRYGHGRKWAKRSAALFFWAPLLFHGAPRRPWPPKRPSHLRRPMTASRRFEELSQNSDDVPAQAAALFHRARPLWVRVRAGKAERGPIPSSTAPIPWGTTSPLASREAEPSSGSRWRPPGDSKRFRKSLTMTLHRPRPYSTVPGRCEHGHE